MWKAYAVTNTGNKQIFRSRMSYNACHTDYFTIPRSNNYQTTYRISGRRPQPVVHGSDVSYQMRWRHHCGFRSPADIVFNVQTLHNTRLLGCLLRFSSWRSRIDRRFYHSSPPECSGLVPECRHEDVVVTDFRTSPDHQPAISIPSHVPRSTIESIVYTSGWNTVNHIVHRERTELPSFRVSAATMSHNKNDLTWCRRWTAHGPTRYVYRRLRRALASGLPMSPKAFQMTVQYLALDRV